MESSQPEGSMPSLTPGGTNSQEQRDALKERTRNPRRMWTTAEDEKLRTMVQRYGDARGSQSRWKEISLGCPGRTAKDCRKRWFHSLDPSLRKGRWTEHEDRVLLSAHASLGPAWHDIALMIPGRKDDQCSKRYNEILNPSAKNRLRRWTAEEDRILTQSVMCLGHRWSTISARLNNRPPLTCRNRWRHLSDRGRSPRGGSSQQPDNNSSPAVTHDTSGTPTTGSSDGDQDHNSTVSTVGHTDTVYMPDPPRRHTFADFLPMSPETESLLSGDMPDFDMLGFSGLDLQQLPLGGEMETSTDYESTTDTHSLRAPTALSTIVEPPESTTGSQWNQPSPRDTAQASNNDALDPFLFDPEGASPAQVTSSNGALHGNPPTAALSQDLHAPRTQQPVNIDFTAIEYGTELRFENGQANGPLVHHHHVHYHHHHYHHHIHHHNYQSPVSTGPQPVNQSAT